MNYKKIYDDLIERALDRNLSSYAEKHHIIPRCLGGSDEDSNIVKLTPEEHYVAHQLLAKIYPNNSSLIYAAHLMGATRKGNKVYAWLRKEYSKRLKDTIFINDGKTNKRINKNSKIPDGWYRGRLINDQKNRSWITDGEDNRFILKCEKIPDGWYKGITNVKRNKKIYITNGSENKLVFHTDEIPKNWKRGMTKWKTKSNEIFINDGKTNKRINKNSKIPDGWYRGRLTKNYKTKERIKAIENSNINFKEKGWTTKLSNLLEMNYSNIRPWMIRNMPDFYNKNCE